MRILGCVIVMLLVGISSASAQFAPSKSEGVQKLATGLNFSNPLGIEGFSLNFDPKDIEALKINIGAPKDLSGFSLNFKPVAQMLQLLKERGAKIEMNMRELNGLSLLDLKVDGKQIPSIVIECKTCSKIEFAY